MSKAIIIDNQAYCPICGSLVGNGKDYKQVLHDGKSYTQFTKYCSNPKCTEIIDYYADVRLEYTNRYSFDNVEIIKESKGDNNVDS